MRQGWVGTGRADWKWWSDEVPTTLKRLHEDGYKLVIFSNQTGISKGRFKARDIRGKILDVIGALGGGLPVQVFVATAESKWCKPSPAMWRHFVEHHNGGVEVDMQQSFHCGDEAGTATTSAAR
jgi:bifunctional polynucleotide phosphatase/kinase